MMDVDGGIAICGSMYGHVVDLELEGRSKAGTRLLAECR